MHTEHSVKAWTCRASSRLSCQQNMNLSTALLFLWHLHEVAQVWATGLHVMQDHRLTTQLYVLLQSCCGSPDIQDKQCCCINPLQGPMHSWSASKSAELACCQVCLCPSAFCCLPSAFCSLPSAFFRLPTAFCQVCLVGCLQVGDWILAVNGHHARPCWLLYLLGLLSLGARCLHLPSPLPHHAWSRQLVHSFGISHRLRWCCCYLHQL